MSLCTETDCELKKNVFSSKSRALLAETSIREYMSDVLNEVVKCNRVFVKLEYFSCIYAYIHQQCEYYVRSNVVMLEK